MNGRPALRRLVFVVKVQGNGSVLAVLEESDVDLRFGRVEPCVNGLELGFVLAMRAGRAVKDDSVRSAVRSSFHDDLLVGMRGEEATHGVVEVAGTLDDIRRNKEGLDPVQARTSKGFKPERGLGDGLANSVGDSLISDFVLDTKSRSDVLGEEGEDELQGSRSWESC